MNKNDYSPDDMNWSCLKCRKEGIVHIPDMIDEHDYYIVCEDCGSGSGYGWCNHCKSGGLYMEKLIENQSVWKCPICQTKHILSPDFFQNPIPFKPTGEVVNIKGFGETDYDFIPSGKMQKTMKSMDQLLLKSFIGILILFLLAIPISMSGMILSKKSVLVHSAFIGLEVLGGGVVIFAVLIMVPRLIAFSYKTISDLREPSKRKKFLWRFALFIVAITLGSLVIIFFNKLTDYQALAGLLISFILFGLAVGNFI